MRDRTGQDLEDQKDLARFGYLQQLQRSMGSFSSFAISFSLISITTGIFGNFGHGLREFGPAVVLAWIVAAVGQFLVALIVADLAARLPIAGYGYQWSSRLISPHFGFFVGWCLLLQFLIGFPAICGTLSDYLCDYSGLSRSFAPWVTIGVVTVISAVHLVGIRVVSWVNDAGVIAEIAGCIAIVAMLLGLWFWAPTANLSILLDSTNAETGAPGTLLAFGSSLLLGAWCITGFEGAADLAEETHQPRHTVPRAVINSEFTSGVGGLIMLIAFMLSISDLSAIQQAPNPLLAIIQSRLSEQVMPIVMIVVYISIFACGVASMAAATRLIFAMARDRMLPGSSFLSRIDPTTHSPKESILLVWLASCIVIPVLQQVRDLSSVATVAAYLGYTGIVIASLCLPETVAAPGFTLGRWRWAVAVLALGWLGTAIAALTLTAPGFPIARACAVPLAIGVVVYFLFIRVRIRSGTAGPPPLPHQQGDAT